MREIMQLIFDLSQISNLIFVGGTSLYLQDIKEEITDIDVLVQNADEISTVFEITIIEDPIYKFQNRQRAYFIRDNIMVDVFIQENNEEVIEVDNYANCCTINAQIQFFEKTLTLELSPERRAKTIAEINFLKTS